MRDVTLEFTLYKYIAYFNFSLTLKILLVHIFTGATVPTEVEF